MKRIYVEKMMFNGVKSVKQKLQQQLNRLKKTKKTYQKHHQLDYFITINRAAVKVPIKSTKLLSTNSITLVLLLVI